MKTITKYVTLDGKEHARKQDAQRWLDMLYSDHITKLAHNTVTVEKYAKMAEFLDANLAQFVYLKAIKDDMAMQIDNDEDSCFDGE